MMNWQCQPIQTDIENTLSNTFPFTFTLCPQLVRYQFHFHFQFSGSWGNSSVWGGCLRSLAKSLTLPLYHTLRLGEGLVRNNYLGNCFDGNSFQIEAFWGFFYANFLQNWGPFSHRNTILFLSAVSSAVTITKTSVDMYCSESYRSKMLNYVCTFFMNKIDLS